MLLEASADACADVIVAVEGAVVVSYVQLSVPVSTSEHVSWAQLKFPENVAVDGRAVR